MSNPINLTARDFSSSRPKFSGAFKKLGGEVTKNLSLSQQKALYEKMKEHKGSYGSVQEAFKDLKKDKKDGVSSFAVSRMEKAFGRRGESAIKKNSSLQAGQSDYRGISSAVRIEKANAEMANRAAGPQLSQNLVNRTSGAMNSGLVVKR
jgi:hypothetical protein